MFYLFVLFVQFCGLFDVAPSGARRPDLEPWSSDFGPLTFDLGLWVQGSRFTLYPIVSYVLITRVSIACLAWKGSRMRLGTQLGHPRGILEALVGKSRERIISCDVLW